ncbi:DNA polymerase/3'-5' exonuclease PolX [Paracnuella aquatica]|uniref:DNA polymerase/3'-5' exonuclease PolX n=1 Tax=Paracnuella aquatica TaxID=2268757 RepID=UPI000DF01986|nr:DNA polymerase/3'-5' exonuclease PolX [Paracnuella aquatica]RPD45127.1 DNA polymerase/3'-5' exonuclease PolX [Paracnuella aquatica]
MDNYALADQFSLLAKLMDIHGANSFKSKSYASAAFAIEKLTVPLAGMAPQKIAGIKGIGDSVAQKIVELLQTGELQVLQELVAQTPEGVLQMMDVKGLGPKKINTIWKDLHISSIEELEQACAENRIATTKGFGAKTQEKILDSIRFTQESRGKFFYAQLDAFALSFTQKLQQAFPDHQLELTGEFRRHLEVISKLEWVTTVPQTELQQHLQRTSLDIVSANDATLQAATDQGFPMFFYFAASDHFGTVLFEKSCSTEFLDAWKATYSLSNAATEQDLFEASQKAFIAPFLRENKEQATGPVPAAESLVQVADIKGLIHAHSNWSDGAHPLEDMAASLKDLGFEYLVISDHSKAAFYANGLSEERIIAQHKLIDDLNRQLAPFKVFKSIECDILGDGTMDYSNDVLASFDLVIASIHSNLDMDEDKAMQRLLGAINNPHVRMMGHLSGRRLLRRPAYPVNYPAIIDACAANGVAIEVNAHPERLDIDWRWIDAALQKGVQLSINPDAHTKDDFANLKYGVLAAQKGGLTAAQNISSFGLQEFEAWLRRK